MRIVKDGSIIDTKGCQGWEWTHGIALTALYHVSQHPHRTSISSEPVSRARKAELADARQHSRLDPSSPSAQFSKTTALAGFESQYKITEGKGAPKNINPMAPFYCLAGMLYDGSVKDERWTRWCDEWAEWIVNDLPREWARTERDGGDDVLRRGADRAGTEENGFQHSEWYF
jgi:unsaturated rhamnogalacturonyl hydrolase